MLQPAEGDLLWSLKGPFVHNYVMGKANATTRCRTQPFGAHSESGSKERCETSKFFAAEVLFIWREHNTTSAKHVNRKFYKKWE